MKVYTVADIQALEPCSNHDPLIYVDITWSGTVIDILKCTQVNSVSRFWVVYRLLDDKTLRLFAVACARRALTSVVNPDIRSIEACNIAEKYANGEATKKELMAATHTTYAAYVAYAAYAAANRAAYVAYAAAGATTAAAAYAERQWQVECLINMLK